VLDGTSGRVDIEAHGIRHCITTRVNRIRQEPVLHREPEPSDVRIGTRLTVHWPDSACSILDEAEGQFLHIAQSFAFLNPHLDLSLSWRGVQHHWPATDPGWVKWLPSNPTSPHWYREPDLARLVAAYLSADAVTGRERLVREFIAEFRGLTGSAKQKQVLDATGLARQPLSALVAGDDLDHGRVGALLAAMQAHSKPVPPKGLGIIGRAHLEARCRALGAEMESFDYGRQIGTTNGLPWVIETAFAWRGDDCEEDRTLVTGTNWSAGIVNPFRQLGRFGQSLDTVLAQQRVSSSDPVIFVLHAACPRVAYSDRGKSAVVLGG